MNHSFAARIQSCGPGGRKCACCNPYQGKRKPMLNRKVRNSLKTFFNKEIKAEMESQ